MRYRASFTTRSDCAAVSCSSNCFSLSVTMLLVSSAPIRPVVRCSSASRSCDSLAFVLRSSICPESQFDTCVAES